MANPRIKSRLTKEYQFDPRLGTTGRYVEKATGRIVSQDVVTNAMELQITQARVNIGSISNQLANGEISLAQWQTAMRAEMKTIHVQSAALAKGGWAQMSQSDWGAVGQLTAKQNFYLQRFAVQIEEGKQKLTNLARDVNGQFLRRADQYAQAGNSTYHKILDREAVKNGLTEERFILDGDAQHCDCCVNRAAKGWQPIGTGPDIGGCTCGQNDRCDKEYGPIDGVSQIKQEVFTPEYEKALQELENIKEVGEFYPGELQDAQDKLDFETEALRIIKDQGLDPATVTKSQWANVANELESRAASELSLATQAGREAAAARAVGRRAVAQGERDIIQVGGQTVEKRWAGGSARQAAIETQRINRATAIEAQNYMTDKLTGFGFDRATVEKLNFTQQRRLMAEIGRGELQAAKIGDISKETRQAIVNSVTPAQRAESLEIAYNPRAAQGLATWNDYETAMVKAGKADYIQAPPDNREQFIPAYVSGEKKYIPEFEF